MDTNTPGHTASSSDLRPIPRISIQAFCETESLQQSIGEFAADRRIARAHVKTHMGGTRAAIEFYQNAPTPNVVIVESDLDGDALVNELNLLADVCDAETKVIVIGSRNDVELYRRLIKFGVSEYLVTPLSTIDLISALGGMYTAPDAEPFEGSHKLT